MASTTICMNTSELTKMSSDDHFDISKEPYIETPWNIIETYFKDQHLERLVRHQLESYNNFVGYQIIKTIEMFNPVHIKSENDYDQTSGKYSLEIFITFENFHIYRPQIHENNGAIKLMFPQEARLRNFTYASAMTIDINIKYIVRNGANLENASTFYKTLPKIHIGKLPIMLKSNICVLNQYKYVEHKHTGECRFDAGGHFIINGSEKTVLGQERAAENRVYCFNISKNNTKYTWSAEIKSVPDFKCISPKQITLYMNSKNNGFGHSIVVQIPRVKQPMPLFVLFRALGVISDKDICEYILLDLKNNKYKAMLENLQASIIDSNKHLTQEECIRHIMSYVIYTPINMDKETGTRKKYEFTLDVINNDLFPHCQTSQQKIYFLGYMANKLLQAQFEWIKADDRDSYLNKRVDLTGTSLNNLFRNYFNKLVKDMEKQIVKEINTGSWRSTEDYTNIINNTNIYKIVKSTTIENGIKRALSTGDFGIKHTNSNKVGVAQVLNRLTYVASLSHLRRISTPTDKSGKLIPPRKLHSTCWGFLCPAETPEGASVGIVKNLSYMTHVTIHSNSMSLHEYVSPHIKTIDTLKPIDTFNKVKVFINGSWIGVTEEPQHLYHLLKDMKCKGIINIYTSIVFDYKLQEIRVCNDSGRITRPLLRVKNNQLLLTNQLLNDLKQNKLSWDDLLTNCNIPEAMIEYIDPEEQSYSMIATKPKDMIKNDEQIYKYTHCEIHPSTIFGVVASCIPYPDHNQSPRNTYQCLDINETVLLTNGRKIPIKDVKIGDHVVCFHPETMDISYTNVVNHYIRETDKTIYKVKTITNKEIIATEDHKFMTMEGWKQVGDFVENDTYIGIMPNPEHIPLENEDVAALILDETMFRNKFIELGLELSYINKQILKLTKVGLLPLYSNHHCLPILARIFGFILADGSINIYEKSVSFTCNFNSNSDIMMFENDVHQCGFDKCKYTEDYFVMHNGGLACLILVLKSNKIPYWIMSGEKIVKREFIAGFEGGDGCSKHIYKNHEFRFQYIQLFEQFNISTDYVYKIGYRYSARKYSKEYALSEYSKCKEMINKADIKIINNMVFIPVVSVEKVENRLVSDITVASDDHSFIAGNNFLSSNCAQAKQAMGVYATNFNERMDKTAYVLNYPTRPLVDTRVMNLIKLNQIPSGCNINVAIMTHTGYNQEDSVLINKGSIDRGLFQINIYHTEKDEDKQKINGDEEIRCKPDSTKTKGMKFGNYNKVNSKGVIPENTLVENRDIIIAKVSPIKENRNDHMKVIKYEDQSKIYRTVEETYIDKNYIDRNGDGYSFAKVRLRALRKPVIGDKFCMTDDHDVLTLSRGWVSIKDVVVEDLVAQLNRESGKLEYVHPLEVLSFDHNDKMYEVITQGISQCVTLNHRMWVQKRDTPKYELLPAEKIIGKRVRYQSGGSPINNKDIVLKLSDNLIYSGIQCDAMLTVFGIFIAEGWTYINEKDYISRIEFAANKPRVQSALFESCEILGLNCSMNAKTYKFYINHKELTKEFEKYSVGAINKYLPEWYKHLSEHQSRVLLEALCLGDGHETETSLYYYTSSIKLRDDVQILCQHAGYTAYYVSRSEPGDSATMKDGRIITTTATAWNIGIRRTRLYPTVNHGHSKEQNGQQENIFDFNGKVYCLRVPSEVFLVRRHGRCSFTGNSSRHGQKGTVGNIIPEEDMPFSRNGDKPDIIINPHAIPSRMTIGQLKETLLGKVLVQLGLFGDGTSFGELNVSEISNKLLGLGYEAHGNELLYNGLTGEQIECSVFMGPVFYQRLKHMVNDKQHSRSIGPMVNLTRQPAEGRSRDGGLRFGEMERDCFSQNTQIVTTNGLSTLIKHMSDCKNEILGWDKNSEQMVPSKQIGFLYKGERDCVKLTFQDGRTTICTPEHPILTSNNEWIKAKDLLNEIKVKASVNYPVANFNEEIAECNNWSLKVGDMLFETNTMENYLKTLIFAKLIGYLITDGTITKFKDELRSRIYLGHMIDVKSFVNDLTKICDTKQKNFKNKNLYSVNIPSSLTKNIVRLKGILVGKKVVQEAQLPDFILDENCPLPIVREFLGGLFGGDGHTCILSMHRGKRDLLTSVSFSQTKNIAHLVSLTEMMENIKKLLARFAIHKVTIQKFKETSYSKTKQHEDENNKNYQLTLHLDIDEIIPFHEKIGFRYCCHKSQRLEAAVSYKRLRTEVTRQHNWIVSRVDELTEFSEIKKENPDKIVPTKKAIQQAVEELKQKEPLVHEYAIPSTHDLTDHLIKGTSFGKFTSKSFPNAEEYLKEICAYDWFINDDVASINPDEVDDELDNDVDESDECVSSCYGVNRECEGLPTMNLKVIDIRPAGIHPVYDIEVENTHSFLANGIVAHNCMVSHGAARFTRGRMYDASDKYSVHACKKCGLIASYNDELHIHQCRTCDNRTDFSYLEIPYACKLLFQELTTMNVVPRVITNH